MTHHTHFRIRFLPELIKVSRQKEIQPISTASGECDECSESERQLKKNCQSENQNNIFSEPRLTDSPDSPEPSPSNLKSSHSEGISQGESKSEHSPLRERITSATGFRPNN